MTDNILHLEEISDTSIIAYETGIQNQRDIAELRREQALVSEYAYSECSSLEADVERLTKFVELMYNSLGISIRGSDGNLRKFEDVSYDFHSLNPKIVFTFQELMQG